MLESMWHKPRTQFAAPFGTSAYVLFFGTVLAKRIIWHVGDQTDVLVPVAAAFPWGVLILGFPGGRNGAFVFAAVLGLVNALCIYGIFRAGDRRQGIGGVFLIALGLLLLMMDVFLSTELV